MVGRQVEDCEKRLFCPLLYPCSRSLALLSLRDELCVLDALRGGLEAPKRKRDVAGRREVHDALNSSTKRLQ